jgi:hypothetical protein
VSGLALVVPFEELAPVVDELRERSCVAKPSHGMPPHVTLLFPAPHDIDAIGSVLREFSVFEVVFVRLDRFPETLWLAPEPSEPFRHMIEAIRLRFPEYPPYGGAFTDVVPHLTVAQSGIDEELSTVEGWLPLRSRAERAVLLEEAEPERWLEVATFELAER